MITKWRPRKPTEQEVLINSLILLVGVVIFIYLPTVLFRLGFENDTYTTAEIESKGASYTYGIVFGAGTRADGEPTIILRDRLDTAANLYEKGSIKRILLSGTNVDDNDETDVMYSYIKNNYNISDDAIILDGYGLRTFDTCVRAAEIYGIDKAILITSDYHLPRSIYLCQDAGIDSIGAKSTQHFYASGTIFVLREVLATHKALLDTLWEEPEYSEVVY